MPYKLMGKDSNGKPFYRYNLDAAVGKGAQSQNRKCDVMLVQALFQVFYYERGGKDATWASSEFRYQPPQPNEGQIKVDGILGPITQRHIDKFLDQMIMYDYSQARNDRTLDPIGPGVVVRRTRIYNPALLSLNDFCGFNERLSKPLHLRKDELPLELVTHLQMEKSDR